ncbi:hypothetical protein K438DRAFT_1970134 [Mycena galopus ATCC 62051]|nr:hypothetical protein K438DRAFT_1970134 [Mycena galopus ATCC 62051]
MSQKPEIIRSASYWKDFHCRRAKIRAQQEQRTERPIAPGDAHVVSGVVPSQPPIIMFMPNRPAPVYSLAQNNGTLAVLYDPTCIRPTPPASNLEMKSLPARCVPPPYSGSLVESQRCAAGKSQIPGPSEDEKLLARLTARMNPGSRPKGRAAEESVGKVPSNKKQRHM